MIHFFIHRFQIRAGIIMAGFFSAAPLLLFSIVLLSGGKGQVSSDIPALERAFNNPEFGAFLSVLFTVGFFALLGFIFGVLHRNSRQTFLLAASHPKSPSHIGSAVRHRFWDEFAYRLNKNGTDMVGPRNRRE